MQIDDRCCKIFKSYTFGRSLGVLLACLSFLFLLQACVKPSGITLPNEASLKIEDNAHIVRLVECKKSNQGYDFDSGRCFSTSGNTVLLLDECNDSTLKVNGWSRESDVFTCSQTGYKEYKEYNQCIGSPQESKRTKMIVCYNVSSGDLKVISIVYVKTQE